MKIIKQKYGKQYKTRYIRRRKQKINRLINREIKLIYLYIVAVTKIFNYFYKKINIKHITALKKTEFSNCSNNGLESHSVGFRFIFLSPLRKYFGTVTR
jgi:hypothetical protein